MSDDDRIRELEEVIEKARFVAEKFVDKVEMGQAKSIETYDDCLNLLDEIEDVGL